MAGMSLYHQGSARRFQLLHAKHQRDDQQKQHRHHPERIGKGQHIRLPHQASIEQTVGLRGSVREVCQAFLSLSVYCLRNFVTFGAMTIWQYGCLALSR